MKKTLGSDNSRTDNIVNGSTFEAKKTRNLQLHFSEINQVLFNTILQNKRNPVTDMSTSYDSDSIDQRLSKSLLRLNFEDRNVIGEEIHGVRSLDREETSELIDESLHRMDFELDKIISSSQNCQHAFETARCLPNTFVNDRDFRLKFLRAELFDPVKAADRMIVYMDYLLHLFGERALVEPLNSSFFNNEETAALREGYMQVLPFRDRSGRRIVVGLWKAMKYKPRTRCKVMLYLINAISEDVETQRKGFVFVMWGGSDDPLDRDNNIKVPGTPGYHERVVVESRRNVEEGVILRLISIHFCVPDTPAYRLVKAFYVFIMSNNWLPRIIFHLGGKTEMRYKLMGFGIPVSHLPDTDTGAVKVKNHIQWLKVRKILENDPIASANICECPGMNDVLFRRAGSCMAHPGNSRFKNFIEAKKDEHKASNQTEKKEISMSIVEHIERQNGRFFKWCTRQTCWIQMTDRSEIRLKVAMSIRDFNRQAKAVQNRQSNISSTDIFQPKYENKRKRESVDSCDLRFLRKSPSPERI